MWLRTRLIDGLISLRDEIANTGHNARRAGVQGAVCGPHFEDEYDPAVMVSIVDDLLARGEAVA